MVNTFALTAAVTAAMRVENFVLIPIFSFNVGMSTFTGQNIGAGRLERVRRGFRATLAMGLATCAAVAVIAYVFAAPLAGLFGVSGDTLATSVRYLRFIAPWFLVFCVFIVANGVLQGAGDVVYTAANTISSLIIRCIAAYTMAYLTPIGGAAAWMSMPFGWVYSLFLTGGRYLWGPWQKKALVSAPADDLPQQESFDEEGLL